VKSIAQKFGLKDSLLTAYRQLSQREYSYAIVDASNRDFQIVTNVLPDQGPAIAFAETL